jgi:hypothetical protein
MNQPANDPATRHSTHQSTHQSRQTATEREALRRDAESTRADLAHTVNALVAKTDVRGRARRRADEVTGNIRVRAQELAGQALSAAQKRPVAATAVGAGAAAAVVGAVAYRRSTGSR